VDYQMANPDEQNPVISVLSVLFTFFLHMQNLIISPYLGDCPTLILCSVDCGLKGLLVLGQIEMRCRVPAK
jgi:hypothetical protein